MHATTEPATGLHFIELSHPWGHSIPVWPGESIDIGSKAT